MQNKYSLLPFGAVLVLGLIFPWPALADQQAEGFHCVITPSQTVELGSPVPGQLQDVMVDRSDTVSKGQVVASLDSRLEQASQDIARFRAAQETQVSLRRAAFDVDSRTASRLNSLAASKVASAQDKDRAAREARLSAWRLQQAKDDLNLYALELARANAALERRRIRSPIDGKVLARLHNPGEYIEDEPLMRIVKLDPLYIEAILPMRLFGAVKDGMQAEVFPELEGSVSHKATVVLVDPMGDAGSGTFGARLSLPNPDNRIPAGVKCRMKLLDKAPILSDLHKKPGRTPRLAATKPASN